MRSARFVSRSLLLVTLALGLVAVAGTPVSAAKTPPTVTIVKVPEIGKVLADSNGMTLYTLTSNGAAVACSGTCASVWPPLVASGTPKGAKGVKRLGVESASGQVTANGLPVYLFTKDTASGQANGQGVNAFGGTWNVVKVTAAPKAKSSTSKTPPGY
jgi:predicted lipoprotein with Yx(FWY)xxD motif